MLALTAARAAEPAYDFVLRGGRIVDGSGNPAFHGDIAVKDGKIAAGFIDEQIEMIFDIIKSDGATRIFLGMSEADLAVFMQHPCDRKWLCPPPSETASVPCHTRSLKSSLFKTLNASDLEKCRTVGSPFAKASANPFSQSYLQDLKGTFSIWQKS